MQSSRDYEDANLALETESLEMGSEIVRLRRKLEQYLLKAEEKERELCCQLITKHLYILVNS